MGLVTSRLHRQGRLSVLVVSRQVKVGASQAMATLGAAKYYFRVDSGVLTSNSAESDAMAMIVF